MLLGALLIFLDFVSLGIFALFITVGIPWFKEIDHRHKAIFFAFNWTLQSFAMIYLTVRIFP